MNEIAEKYLVSTNADVDAVSQQYFANGAEVVLLTDEDWQEIKDGKGIVAIINSNEYLLVIKHADRENHEPN